MDYPHDFPPEAQAAVEGEKIEARKAFDKAKEKTEGSRHGSLTAIQKLLAQYIMRVFAVFARESCALGRNGIWTVVRIRSECERFLESFSVEAYDERGYDTNGQSISHRVPIRELKASQEWARYEDERLEVAKLQAVRPVQALKKRERESKKNSIECLFPNRSAWLKERLNERSWNRNKPSKYGGPDPKTIDKILAGGDVREDVLEKLATALSKKYAKVEIVKIPNS